ncbi:MAG: DUF2520 domain-containing protein [Myxococcota bacterium]|nr:DUF2520 domain-containing protein [Myxococcota bacterium]
MRIAIYGPGRLGRTLAELLPAAGHQVVIWRRGEPHPTCDVAWLTVSDAAIASVSSLVPAGPIVLHASGSQGLGPVAQHTEHGSLHPLQSFPGPEVAIPPIQDVPAAIAGTPAALDASRQLALDLGFSPFHVPGDRRLYHASAVMAGNFATVLLQAASQLMAEAGVDPGQAPALLAPLAMASLKQAALSSPAQALTGPFARGDEPVIAQHQAAIREHRPELSELYEALAVQARVLAKDFPSKTR